jgi:hypothetical protein
MVCLFDSLSLIAACAAIYPTRKSPVPKRIAPRPAIRQTLFANPAADQSRGGTQCVVIPCVRSNPNAALFRSLAYLW